MGAAVRDAPTLKRAAPAADTIASVPARADPQLFAVLAECAELTSTSLQFTEEFDASSYLDYCAVLFALAGGLNWWIGDAMAEGERMLGESYAQVEAVAERFGIAPDRLRQCQWVSERVEPVTRVTGLSWSHHRHVAALPPRDQFRLLADSIASGWDANKLRVEVAKHRRGLREAGELPHGVFRVLYADPPWRYAQVIDKYGPAERHYPTMDLEEICELPVSRLAADDSVLFLWATSPKLVDATTVVAAWGFTYKASFVWYKVRHNYGHYNSVRHEHLLVAVRGHYTPEAVRLHNSVLTIERAAHSEKPEEFRALIEELYPTGPHIELFARRPAPGWTIWGDEVAAASGRPS